MTRLRFTNLTRNSIIATHATPAVTPDTRRNGLIGLAMEEFGPGAGLFFPECNAIHTVQMSFPIDVLFIDMLHQQIVKAVPYAAPGCHFNTLIPRDLCAVLELPPGTIEISGTRAGDRISIMSSTHCSQDELNKLASSNWGLRG